MVLLAALIFVFGIIHLNPAMPAWKAHAQQTFGKAYGPVYGILSLALFAVVIWAFRQVDPVPLYTPPSFGLYANFTLSLVGFIFIGIFLFRGSWRNSVKYPMAIGISFWALGHLFANGDQRTVLLFAGLAAAAIFHAILKSGSSFQSSVERQGHNLLSVLGGIALYGLATQLHMVIAGVPVVTLR
jgi:uncharacterized membrane protein